MNHVTYPIYNMKSNWCVDPTCVDTVLYNILSRKLAVDLRQWDHTFDHWPMNA